MRVLLLVAKDLRVLRRTPLLLGVLLAYPLVIAALVGLVAGYASSKPRVALVDEDGLPSHVVVQGRRFDIDRAVARVSRNVRLVRLSRDEASRELRTGRVVATLTVPPGFVADLRTAVRRPHAAAATRSSGCAATIMASPGASPSAPVERR